MAGGGAIHPGQEDRHMQASKSMQDFARVANHEMKPFFSPPGQISEPKTASANRTKNPRVFKKKKKKISSWKASGANQEYFLKCGLH